MMKTSQCLLGLLITLPIALLFTSCGSDPGAKDASGEASAVVVAVRTAAVTEASAEVSVMAYGATDALRKETVSAPLSGRLVELAAFEGNSVRTGDLLAVILTKESQSAILGARSMARSATSPQQQADAARMLSLAESTQQQVSLTASFDGIVSSRSVSKGELVSEHQDLFTVVDLRTVVFFADIPLRDLSSVHVGAPARIQFPALGSEVFSGRVEALSPQTNSEGQTVRARLGFGALSTTLRALLRTEMVGTATIVTGSRPKAFFVPRAALVRNDEDNTYAIVTITSDSLALHVPVDVGITTDSTVEISGRSIAPGLVVITEGNYSLADSTHVKVAEGDGP